MKKTIIGLAAAALAFTLLLSACGDKTPGNTTTGSNRSTSAPASSSTSEHMLDAQDGKVSDVSESSGGVVGDIVTDLSDAVSEGVSDVSRAVS